MTRVHVVRKRFSQRTEDTSNGYRRGSLGLVALGPRSLTVGPSKGRTTEANE